MKEKAIFFGAIFTLLVNISYSQEYLTMSSNNILIMLDTTDKDLSFIQTKDYIEVNYSGYDKFSAYYSLTKYHGCDSIYIEYYCTECVKSHIEDIFSSKREKWIEIDNGLYISNKRTSFELGFRKSRLCTAKYLRIEKTPEDEISARVCFWLEEMTHGDWKKKTKK